jgi:SAM-dependent methyltransferase
MTTGRDWDARADALAARAMDEGRPTGWFDELWSAAERDEVDMPWDRSAAADVVVEEVAALGDPAGRRAVVVGAGLGADAEQLARTGWSTTAFDVSAAAVRVARGRYPGSAVDYRVADLLDLPQDMVGAYDLVVEVFTVQALPPSLRAEAVRGVRRLLAPGGTAVAVQFVRGDRPADAGPPWLLDRAEMESFAGDDVVLERLRTAPHGSRPDGADRFVAVLRRA